MLAPNDFNDTAEVARTLNQFERHYRKRRTAITQAPTATGYPWP